MYIRDDTEPYGSRTSPSDLIRRQGTTSGTSSSTSASASANSTQEQQSAQAISSWTKVAIVVVVVTVMLFLLLIVYHHLRKLRLQNKEPRFLPARLKGRWQKWKPRGKYASVDGQEGTSLTISTGETQETTTAVDRRTSVRSVITLPAYSRMPKEHEEVLGREGERAGMDVVEEFPETAHEEEERREEEMESLYQIRQTRRQEIAEREERRRQRREAREAGDLNRLEELRQESRQRRQQNVNASTTTLTAEALIAEHNARGRDRRVSSVSYAAIGRVRHDGSRVRANSKDSELGGLLSGAAPMGSVPSLPHGRQHSGSVSMLSVNDLSRTGTRARSDSAATSVSSIGSSFDHISRNDVRPTTSGTSASSMHRTINSVSDSGSDDADIVDERVEPSAVTPGASPLPPTYDDIEWGDAPAYTEAERIKRMSTIYSIRSPTSPIGSDTRSPRVSSYAPQLPQLSVGPMINVEGATAPNSPAVGRDEEQGSTSLQNQATIHGRPLNGN